jgi:hypothetical protein
VVNKRDRTAFTRWCSPFCSLRYSRGTLVRGNAVALLCRRR